MGFSIMPSEENHLSEGTVIVSFHNDTRPLLVSTSRTLAELMDHIERERNIPVEHQAIVIQGNRISETDYHFPLTHWGVSVNSTIIVLIENIEKLIPVSLNVSDPIMVYCSQHGHDNGQHTQIGAIRVE